MQQNCRLSLATEYGELYGVKKNKMLLRVTSLKMYFFQIQTVSTISSFKGDNDTTNNGLRRSRTFPIPLLSATDGQRQKRREKREQREQRNQRDAKYKANQKKSAQHTFETGSSSSASESNSRSGSLRKHVAPSNGNFDDVKPIKFSYSRREVKKAQKLSYIVLFFIICWVPLYSQNAMQAFWTVNVPSWLLDAFIILSHVNSAVNPIL